MSEQDVVREALWLDQHKRTNAYASIKPIEDGAYYAAVAPFMFTHAIIVGRTYDDDTYEDRWCYHSRDAAVVALEAWDGKRGTEPEGWHRHPPTGRRRPDGDASQEYVNY